MKNYRTFETERLFLRPTHEEDAAFMLELLNTPKALQYVGDRNVHTEEDARKYIADRIAPQLERLGYSNCTVVRKSDGAKLGVCGLYDRPGVEGVDIGFSFLPQFEKQGYAFEAATRIKQAALEDFQINPIHAYTTRDNLGSQRLLLKLGFAFVEIRRLPDDEEDLMFFSFP